MILNGHGGNVRALDKHLDEIKPSENVKFLFCSFWDVANHDFIKNTIGESAILILAAGGSITVLPRFASIDYPFILPDSARTLAVHLYYQATSYDTRGKAFATGVVLIFIVLILNYLINQISKSYRKKFAR